VAGLARLVVVLAIAAGLLFAAVGGGGEPPATPSVPASSTIAVPAKPKATPDDSGVGDSKSDDPSDDEPDGPED
jgi:hypothetical protein